jgi:hypothetical protein
VTSLTSSPVIFRQTCSPSDLRLRLVPRHTDAAVQTAPAGTSPEYRIAAQRHLEFCPMAEALPDCCLVLTGQELLLFLLEVAFDPGAGAAYVFDAPSLVARLRERGVKIGIATSVPDELWRAADTSRCHACNVHTRRLTAQSA